ncbi:MAG TPA: histidine phosphatase family protein [Acidobacteria bacterium]|nr:histidine phosphatase family protein [Acidobacteriota bacterium]
MTPTLRLFLARHGETPGNREMRYLGAADEPLSATGESQADGLAAALGSLPIAAIYASPRRRTMETGRRIAAVLGLDLQMEERLREQCFGEWEGKTRPEVLANDREALLAWEADLSLAPPGGDSLNVVQERVVAFVEEMRRDLPGAWVALVSHVGPIKALLCAALGVPLAAARRLFLDPGTLTVVDWGERPVVRLFNAHGHLGWGEARWMREGSPPAVTTAHGASGRDGARTRSSSAFTER